MSLYKNSEIELLKKLMILPDLLLTSGRLFVCITLTAYLNDQNGYTEGESVSDWRFEPSWAG